MNSLLQARTEINEIDAQIAKLFEQRMQAASKVAQYKQQNGLPVYDEKREKELIEKNCSLICDKEFIPYYKNMLASILSESKKYQQSILNKEIVAYAGVEGAYAHIASKRLFPQNTLKNYITFEDAVAAVSFGDAEYAVIPFENSYTGEVGEVFDILYYSDVYINRFYDVKIDHSLLCIKGAKIEDIEQVYSHPQALSQCRDYLKAGGYELIPFENTAMAAKYVSEQQDIKKAAVASNETAELYGLNILAEGINTSKDNTTRFAVISRKLNKAGNRFSILFTLSHKAGQLAGVMEIIARYGFNMENIKSKSVKKIPWEYYFYAELIGDASSKNAEEMLKELEGCCNELKMAGIYTKNES